MPVKLRKAKFKVGQRVILWNCGARRTVGEIPGDGAIRLTRPFHGIYWWSERELRPLTKREHRQ